MLFIVFEKEMVVHNANYRISTLKRRAIIWNEHYVTITSYLII